MVQGGEAIVQRGQAEALTQVFRQVVRQRLGGLFEQRHGLIDQRPQTCLGKPLGGGVDRCQVVFHRRFTATDQTIFRVVDLQTGRAGAGLAKGAHPHAGAKLLLLRRREVEEAQAEDAAAVTQSYQQAAAATADHVGGGYLALDHRLVSPPQGGDGGDPGAVLVAQRQVKQQVLDSLHLEPGQLQGQRLADPLERRDRVRQPAHGVSDSAARQRAMASVTASMALGRGKLARQAIATVRPGGSVKGRLISMPLS